MGVIIRQGHAAGDEHQGKNEDARSARFRQTRPVHGFTDEIDKPPDSDGDPEGKDGVCPRVKVVALPRLRFLLVLVKGDQVPHDDEEHQESRPELPVLAQEPVEAEQSQQERDAVQLAQAPVRILLARRPPGEIEEHVPREHVVHLIADEEIKIAGVVRVRPLPVGFAAPSPLENGEVPVLLPVQIGQQGGETSRVVFIHRRVNVRPDHDHGIGREPEHHEQRPQGREVEKALPVLPRPVRQQAQSGEDEKEDAHAQRVVVAGDGVDGLRELLDDAGVRDSQGHGGNRQGEIDRILPEHVLPENPHDHKADPSHDHHEAEVVVLEILRSRGLLGGEADPHRVRHGHQKRRMPDQDVSRTLARGIIDGDRAKHHDDHDDEQGGNAHQVHACREADEIGDQQKIFPASRLVRVLMPDEDEPHHGREEERARREIVRFHAVEPECIAEGEGQRPDRGRHVRCGRLAECLDPALVDPDHPHGDQVEEQHRPRARQDGNRVHVEAGVARKREKKKEPADQRKQRPAGRVGNLKQAGRRREFPGVPERHRWLGGHEELRRREEKEKGRDRAMEEFLCHGQPESVDGSRKGLTSNLTGRNL